MRSRLRVLRRVGPLGAALTAGQVALLVHRHLQAIPEARRRRLGELVRRSKGRPSNLSDAERRELRKLVRALELPRLARRSARVAALGMRSVRKP